MRHNKLALAIPAILALSAAQAHANIVITATFDSSWASDANAAADQAQITNAIANNYENTFTNPIDVKVVFSNMTSGLGQSSTTYYGSGYSQYVNALTAVKSVANGGDGNSAFLSNLPAGGNPVPGNGGAGVTFSSAQGRALGFNTNGVVTVAGQAGTFDSQVSFNTGLIHSAGYDIKTVALHELDEVLGLHTELDGRADASGTASFGNVGSLDFFRYSAPGVRSFTTSSNAVSYFSDDGGVTPIVYFNQGAGGDRHDWASNGEPFAGAPQVQDAYGTPGSHPSLGNSEFQALNDIGYNRVAQTTAVPEPGAMSIIALFSVGMFGMVLRSRKRGVNS